MVSNNDHILTLPTFITYLKYIQAGLSILLLALSAFQLSLVSWSGDGMMLFSSLFSITALVYYFISLHKMQHLYNWIALIVLESVSVLLWLCSWALLAAVLGGTASGAGYSSYWYTGYSWSNPWDADNDPWDDVYRRDASLEKRGSVASGYGAVVIVSVTFGLINWLLYCVTLVYMAMSVYRHRKTNRPMSPAKENKVEVQTV